MFGFFRRKRTEPKQDPLAAYDAALESLEAEGAQLRRSAATLIALRADLSRAVEKHEAQIHALEGRANEAQGRGDESLASTLLADRVHAERMLETSREALAKTEADAELLETAARENAEKLSALRAERTQARARLAVGGAVMVAFQHTGDRVLSSLKLEQARDEVERAQALAEIYREDQQSSKLKD